MGKKHKWLQKGMALALTAVMTLGTVFTDGLTLTARADAEVGTAAAAVSVTKSAGYTEGAYVEWALTEGADGYEVYVSEDQTNDNSWVQLDDELIRKYTDGDSTYMRADALGLTPGTWYVKIVAAKYNSEKVKLNEVAEKVETVTVTAHDRSGFAWTAAGSGSDAVSTASGAYNEDGSLKDKAVVLYVTDSTKDKVSVTLDDGSKTVTGIQNIFTEYGLGTVTAPLDVRVIGTVTDPATLLNGDLVFKNKQNGAIGVTIEGVGEDAVISGFGLTLEDSSNVEVRNLGFMLCDSQAGDSVSLVKNNDHIWVHNCDLFYGMPNADDDQAKGDGALDCKESNYVTFSYNHFWDCGKSCLLGLEENATNTYFITYHHNWFDHSDSRHPRVRYYTAHVYNNYFDGNSKYGIGATCGSSIFAENNYFRNCVYPMKSSQQGSDKSTFESVNAKKLAADDPERYEDGGIIKAYGNYMTGQSGFINGNADVDKTATSDGNDKDTASVNAESFDAYVVSRRTDKIPDSVVTKKGEHPYNNFDTAADFYNYELTDTLEVPDVVKANAGRLNGGDVKWTFGNTDDSSSSVNTGLKDALLAYEGKLTSVGGILGSSEKSYVKVTFDPDNGGTPTETEVELNQPVTESAAPTLTDADAPEGKVAFGYWYAYTGAANGTDSEIEWDFADAVTADMTLKAKWYTQEESDASKNGGTPIAGETVKYSMYDRGALLRSGGSKVVGSPYFEITGDMKKENSQVSGTYAAGTDDEWKVGGGQYSRMTFGSTASVKFTTTTTESLLVVLLERGTTKAILVDGTSVTPTDAVVVVESIKAGDHTLTSKNSVYLKGIMVVPLKYAVRLETNGGAAMEDAQVPAGYAMEEPTAPTWEGHAFVGWYTDTELTTAYDFTTIVNAGFTLYAKWIDHYTVTFETNGGTAVESVNVPVGSVLTEPAAPTKENYVFGGWFTDAECKTVYDFTQPVNADITLYAQWNATGAQPEPEPQPVAEEGLNITLVGEDSGFVYTGSAIKPEIIVTNNGEILTEGVDYTVKYANNINASKNSSKTPSIMVTGKGNLSGVYTKNFEIRQKSITDADVIKGDVVTDDTKKAIPVLCYNGISLKINKDFKAAVLQTDDESGELLITGIGNYTSDTVATLKIVKDKSALKKFTVALEKGVTYTYNGQAQEAAVKVTNPKDKTKPLVKDTDYKLIYSDNVNAGQAKVTVVGIGDYTGSVVKKFTIKPQKTTAQTKNINADAKSGYAFDSAGVTIDEDIQVTAADGTVLTLGKDYKLTYSKNKKVGTATYKVAFLGNYKGSKTAPGTFTIRAASLADAKVVIPNKISNGKAGGQISAPYISMNHVVLKKSDYTCTYYFDEECKKVITKTSLVTVPESEDDVPVYVKIEGKGNYAGSSTVRSYKVCAAPYTDLSKAKVTVVDASGNKLSKVGYTGEEIEPKVRVEINGTTLKEGADYTLAYVGNVNKGKATVIVTGTGIGNYAGSKTATFSIVSGNLGSLVKAK